jgi:hypothetical protein
MRMRTLQSGRRAFVSFDLLVSTAHKQSCRHNLSRSFGIAPVTGSRRSVDWQNLPTGWPDSVPTEFVSPLEDLTEHSPAYESKRVLVHQRPVA